MMEAVTGKMGNLERFPADKRRPKISQRKRQRIRARSASSTFLRAAMMLSAAAYHQSKSPSIFGASAFLVAPRSTGRPTGLSGPRNEAQTSERLQSSTSVFLDATSPATISTGTTNSNSNRTNATGGVTSIHRKVASRKSQLLWIAQTVEKIQAREERAAASTSTHSPFLSKVADTQLVQALYSLRHARTQQQVLEAGRLLAAIDIVGTQVVAVQERVVKAAAMTGLLPIALSLTENMLLNLHHLPSETCQNALSDSLRKIGRLGRLQQLLLQFGSVANNKNNASPQPEKEQRISIVAFNSYLAALCNIVTGKDLTTQHQQQQTTTDTDNNTNSWSKQQQQQYNSYNSKNGGRAPFDALDQAWKWLRDPDETLRCMAIVPDSVSFATVIQAAAAAGNSTLVHAIWDEMKRQNIHPNICAYNARLRTVTSSRSSRGQRYHRQGDNRSNNNNNEELLQIWDTEIAQDPYVQPDKYSIDLILLPLIRAGRVGDVEALLDSFVKRNSRKVVSDAFTAFLLTIVGGGELSTARALFETYVLTTLSPLMESDAGGMIRMVKPTTRHFNVLLEGYRKQAQSNRNRSQAARKAAFEEGWALYRLMLDSPGIRADAYTITSTMGLCQTSTELSHLIRDAVTDLNIEVSPIVLRAALTAYGKLDDASSAVWLFCKYSSCSTRTWNVLLGSLANVAETHPSLRLNPDASNAARNLATTAPAFMQLDMIDRLQGFTVVETAQIILSAMSSQSKIHEKSAPQADSQTYCLAACAMQYDPTGTGEALGNEIFHNATANGVPADGRFVNAALRCFGDDIEAALTAWRNEIRPQCLTYENRTRAMPRTSNRSRGKNLLAAYNGLLHVCGRDLRPDIALRLVYAMQKEGLEPNESSLNSYHSGRRLHKLSSGLRSSLARKLKVDPYESLLYIECMKYDRNDRRRSGERRVRIIV